MPDGLDDLLQQAIADVRFRVMKTIVRRCLQELELQGKISKQEAECKWDIQYPAPKHILLEHYLKAATAPYGDGAIILISVSSTVAEKEDILETVCHETVHLMQWAKGHMKVENKTHYWMGKAVKVLPGNASKEEYDNQEWEKEAFDLGPQLAKLLRSKYSLWWSTLGWDNV